MEGVEPDLDGVGFVAEELEPDVPARSDDVEAVRLKTPISAQQ